MDIAVSTIQTWWRSKMVTVILNFGNVIDRMFSLPMADQTSRRVRVCEHTSIEDVVRKIYKEFSFCYRISKNDNLSTEGKERKIKTLKKRLVNFKDEWVLAVTLGGFFYIYDKGLDFFCAIRNTIENAKKDFVFSNDIAKNKGFDEKLTDCSYLRFAKEGVIHDALKTNKSHRTEILQSIAKSHDMKWDTKYSIFEKMYPEKCNLWNIFRLVEYCHVYMSMTFEDYMSVDLMSERLYSLPNRLLEKIAKGRNSHWQGPVMDTDEQVKSMRDTIKKMVNRQRVDRRSLYTVTSNVMFKRAKKEGFDTELARKNMLLLKGDEEDKNSIAEVWRYRIGQTSKVRDGMAFLASHDASYIEDAFMVSHGLYDMMYVGGLSLFEAMKSWPVRDLNSLWLYGCMSTKANCDGDWIKKLKEEKDIPILLDTGILKMTDIFSFKAIPTTDGITIFGTVCEKIKIDGPFRYGGNGLRPKDIFQIRQHSNIKLTLYNGIEIYGFVVFRCVCKKCKRLVIKVIYTKGDVENNAFLKKRAKAFNRYATTSKKRYDPYCNLEYGKYDFFSDCKGLECRKKGSNIRHILLNMGDFRHVKSIDIVKSIYCGNFTIRFSNVVVKDLFSNTRHTYLVGKIFFENTGMYLEHNTNSTSNAMKSSTDSTTFIGRFMGSRKKFHMGVMFVNGLVKFSGSFKWMSNAHSIVPYGYGKLHTSIDFKNKHFGAFYGNTIVKDSELLYGCLLMKTAKRVTYAKGQFYNKDSLEDLAKVGKCSFQEFVIKNGVWKEERFSDGEWEDNMMEKGLRIIVDEDIQKEHNLIMYQGFLNSGLAHGFGSALSCNGERFQGFFNNGKFIYGHTFSICPSNDNMQRYQYNKEDGFHLSERLPLHFPLEIERNLMKRRICGLYQHVMKPWFNTHGNNVEKEIVNTLASYNTSDKFYVLAEKAYYSSFKKSTTKFKGFIYRDLIFNIMHNVALSVNDIIASCEPKYGMNTKQKEFNWCVFPENVTMVRIVDSRIERIGLFECPNDATMCPINLKSIRLRKGIRIDEMGSVREGSWKRKKFSGIFYTDEGKKHYKNSKIVYVEDSDALKKKQTAKKY